MNSSDRKDFLWRSDAHTIHTQRHKQIKAAHPEVADLEGNDPWTLLPIVFMTVTHISMAILVGNYVTNNIVIALLGWILGGYWAAAAGLAMHEASHGLVLKGRWPSMVAGMIGEYPLFFPAYKAFQHYHMTHHTYNTIDIDDKLRKEAIDSNRKIPRYDPDLPTQFEAKLFSGNAVTRLIFLMMQPILYSLRPMLEAPKKLEVEDFLCLMSQLGLHSFTYYFGGLPAIFYLFCSLLLGTGFHISATHFIAEHY
jgi:sphingolipid delta-4 desaturase